MVNRGGVGAVFAQARAPLICVLLLLGAGLLLRSDIVGPSARPDTYADAALSNPQQIRAAFGRLPVSFEPNQGQSDRRVRFLAHGNGYGLYLTSSEAVLALPQRSQGQSRSVVEMQFGGANSTAQLAGTDRLPGRSNYFIGNDPSRWRRNIPQYSRVRYRNLYPGIDLDFYGSEGRLEYDFEVSPGSNPSRIELNFNGTKNLEVAASGDLVLALEGGELRLQAPRVYQKTAGGTQPVAGSFVLESDHRVQFRVGEYDRSRTLVIDPVLTFSTYLGGPGNESCTAITGAPAGFVPNCPAIAVDSASRVYVAGATSSTAGFPVPVGGSAGTDGPLGGAADVFVVRLDSSGTAIDYTTFVGGSGTEYPAGVGVDSGFNVYVAGTTDSPDFPVTAATAFQSGPGSANTNHVFVTKLNSSGSVDLYSTYLSGTTGVDTASGLAVDGLGRAYVFGITSSSDFPLTAGALQNTFAPTNQFFFSKVDPSASGTASLQYSTFIGSTTSTGGIVNGGAIAVDSSSNVYLAGGTNIANMPVVNAYQGALQGGTNVWAARLNAPSNNTQQYTPLYETYLGGPNDSSQVDVAYGVASDGTNTYITGSTTSTNIPLTPTPTATVTFPRANGGGIDAFIAKFGAPTSTGTTQGTVPLSYFTYLGGSSADAGLAIVADVNQNARVTGLTKSSDFPNSNPLPGSPGGTDAFFARIVTTGTSTTASSTSVLGGSGTDIGTSITVDASLNTYMTGETSSNNFPLASPPGTSPLQPTFGGATDAFVSKLGPAVSLCFSPVIPPTPCPTNSTPTVSPTPVGVGNQVTFKYSIYNTGDPLAGVLFTDILGPNSTFVSGAPSPGTCPSTVVSGTVVCNLGTVPTSVITTSGSTSTIAAAATVTVTVASTIPTATGVMPPQPPPISNTGTLNVPVPNSASGVAIVNDFGISVSPASATVTAGVPAAYVVTVTPTGPFPESVSLGCGSGLPSGASCSFPTNTNPIPNLSNGPQSRPFEIKTTARVTTPGSLFRPGPVYALWFPVSGLAVIMTGAGVSRRKRRLWLGIFFAAGLATVMLQAGCGSSSSTTSTTTGTPAGTYTITINATSVAVRTTTVQLTVQ